MRAVFYLSFAFPLSLAQAGCDHLPAMEEDPIGHTDAVQQQLREELVEGAHPTVGNSPVPKENAAAASARIQSVAGKNIQGEIELQERDGYVQLTASVKGLSPGKHGFHIHEKGDCSDIRGGSMGGHFNPQSTSHKLPHEGENRHLGDLGNLQASDQGRGAAVIRVEGATLEEGHETSVLGRAVVIHSGTDHGESEQPSGDAGTPVACAVIERS